MAKHERFDAQLEVSKTGHVVFGESSPEVHGKWVRWMLRDEGWTAFIEHVDGKLEILFETAKVTVPTRKEREQALKELFDKYANPLFKVNIP